MLYDYPGRMLVASIRSIFLMKTCLKAVANCSGNKKFRSQASEKLENLVEVGLLL